MTTQTKTPAPAALLDAEPKREAGVPALYYYPDTDRLRTPFRDSVIEFIYQTALEMDDGRIESVRVSVYTPRIECDVETLQLTFMVDMDLDAAFELDCEIQRRLDEWGKDWSDAQRKDVIQRIDFMHMPSSYYATA